MRAFNSDDNIQNFLISSSDVMGIGSVLLALKRALSGSVVLYELGPFLQNGSLYQSSNETPLIGFRIECIHIHMRHFVLISLLR